MSSWTRSMHRGIPAVAVLALGLTGGPSNAADPDRAQLAERARGIFGVLPEEAPNPDNPFTPEKIQLGRMLYYDTRFSLSQEISCNTCHPLARYGVDGEPTSVGHEGKRGERNAPTVYNAAFHIAQFWDGRAADVEEQAKGPVLNPVEMAMPSEDYVLRVLRSIPGYQELFRKAFPEDEEPINYDNFGRAIGAFERRLVTPSRFDAFLEGDLDALSDAEVRGLQTFLDTGCIACHVGPTVGGTMYQKVGAVHPYPTEDVGRYAVTKEEKDRHVFKVPSLRNVAETAPYFHDGQVKTLEEAVRKMAYHQLGRELEDAQVAQIITFLESLTGRIDEEYVARPELPESSESTPTPDPS